ncbi:hypothetical protein GE09DRAFT_262041 [Coniochaeta sp. 2T2.1]|nr:hypothetical protein GE09DRAFT_262041 [Coniochaeta sp. 2T2.1]
MSPLPPPPPPVQPPDPLNIPHNSAGATVNIVTWTLFAVCTVFLCLRIYCKRVSRRWLWWDDYFLCTAWLVHLVSCIILSVMVSWGFGLHSWDRPWSAPDELLMQWARNTLTMTAAAWAKTGFGVTLLRFTEGWMKWTVWFLLVTMNLVVAANAIMNWVGCHPVEKSWRPDVAGYCADTLHARMTLDNVSGGYAAACDFVLSLLPWPLIWHVQMRPYEKLGIGVAMSCGILAGIMASLKTATLVNLSTGDDFDVAILSVWDGSEVAVTIIAACIPTLRVLVRDSMARCSASSPHTSAVFGGKGPDLGGVWPTSKSALSNNNNVTAVSDSKGKGGTQHPLEKLYASNHKSDDFIPDENGDGGYFGGPGGGGGMAGVVCTEEVGVHAEEGCVVYIGEGYRCQTPNVGRPRDPGGPEFELQDLSNLSGARSRD